MALSKLLIANRGEIAIRIQRAASELGMRSVAVFPEDDRDSLHVRRADEAHQLSGTGAAAYLDIDQLAELARSTGSDAVHPGYGFLSESAAFARACQQRGVVFVGPRPELLELFGDKARARTITAECQIPLLPGTESSTTLEQAKEFFAALPDSQAMMIKAVAGGGGRGVRVVRELAEIDDAWERCASEAKAAFGSPELYVETFLPRARHVEVQIAGDGNRVTHLWERDCSLQRRYQKLIEIAPAPGLPAGVRTRILAAAVQLAHNVGYDNLGTFEFLVDAEHLNSDSFFAFIEANARLQVEHTVTEEVTGIDLVQLQLRLAEGHSLDDLGLPRQPDEPRGFAIQARLNMETMGVDGSPRPATGALSLFEPPAGPGVRVDSFGYAGYQTSARYDSLLAKIIAHHSGDDWHLALQRLKRALDELRIEGVPVNDRFLRALLEHQNLQGCDLYTHFIDDHGDTLAATAAAATAHAEPRLQAARAGARIDEHDPLAVLAYGHSSDDAVETDRARSAAAPEGSLVVETPLQGTVVSLEVSEGDAVSAGQLLVIMESMKMEHELRAEASGIVRQIGVRTGEALYEGQPLLFLEPTDEAADSIVEADEVDLDEIRPDLEEVLSRRARTLDAARTEAVARRHAKGLRTARENVEDLCDPGSFVEYGALTLAAQRRRRSIEELIEKTPADGMVTGVGSINGDLFDEPACRCAVLSYDYMVLAGTQGTQNHRKTDRLLSVAEDEMLPLVLFAEGGGGRPGDTDKGVGGPGDTRTFSHFARLSGLVPLIGITTGRCFAGNASLLGCCDVIIATEGSNIGMGGPAMIEGGGLGIFKPEEIGPMSVQVPNGVVDIAVADEAEAVDVAKRYLSYFQGRLESWEAPDQRSMRRIVPENRLRIYDVRQVIETLADTGTVLELRRDFGIGMVTSLVRVEGRAMGVVANNPTHLGGAIDSDGADKAARFLQLCDAFDLPVLFLCDTPGIMVGPEVERTALVRHANRMFLIGGNLSVPFFTIILRKAYGLGGIAMGGGSYKEGLFTVSWPTGEFGGMGLEGSVKLGYRNELAAIEDPNERKERYEEMVARAYEIGKGLNQASQFAVDDTIDPAESREWVARALGSYRPPPRRTGKKRPAIDGW